MAYYPKAFLEQLKSQLSVYELASEYTTLSPAGVELYQGVCPLPGHNDKDPSFTVFTHSNSWSCFGCGKGGDIINFLKEVNNWTFEQAVDYLCERLNVPKPEQHDYRQMFQENRTLEIIYRNRLRKNTENSLDYLLSRGLTLKTIVRWGLGANGKNRIIFPLYDRAKQILGFSERYIVQPANRNDKYRHPSNYLDENKTVLKPYYNKASYLYGIHLYDFKASDCLYFCEGALDAILADQYGLVNCLSTLGKNFTDYHLSFLQSTQKKPVFLYDNDEAGLKGIHSACKKCEAAGIEPYLALCEAGKDLADTAVMIKEQLPAFIQEHTVSYSFYLIQDALKNYQAAFKALQYRYYNLFENCLMALDNDAYYKARTYLYQQTHLLIETPRFRDLTESVSDVYCTLDYLILRYQKDLYELQKPYYKIFQERLHKLSTEDYGYACTFITEVTGMHLQEEK